MYVQRYVLGLLLLLLGLLGCAPVNESKDGVEPAAAMPTSSPISLPPTMAATAVAVSTQAQAPATVSPTVTIFATSVPAATATTTPLPTMTNTNTPSPLPSMYLPTPQPTPIWADPLPALPNFSPPATPLADDLILSVVWITDEFAWGVGKHGYIGYWQDSAWTQIDSPTKETLNDVAFAAPDNGWAVGENANILHWDGTGWTLLYSYGTPYYDYIFEDVEFASPTDMWSVGYINSEGGSGGLLAHWQWDGAAWVQQDVPPLNCPCTFSDMMMFSETDGWVVGFQDTTAFIMRWDGTTWQEVPNPYTDKGGSWLYKLSGSEPDDLVAEGLKQTADSMLVGLTLHWDGETWQER